ncbi:MAG: hypothetical protein ABEJ31_00600 [Haloarculaceae archaeon]
MTDPARLARESTAPPDLFFSVVVGLYAVLLAAPVAAELAALAVTNGAVLYVLFLASAGVLIATVSLAVRRARGVAVRLGATTRAWAIPIVAAVAAVGQLVVWSRAGDAAVRSVAFGAAFASLLGALVGLAVVSMVRTRFAAAVVDGGTVERAFSAGWPARQRRRAQYAGGLLMIVGGLGFVADSLRSLEWAFLGGELLLIAGVALATAPRTREYRVTPDGLELAHPLIRRFVDWETLAGYAVTDDALYVRWRAWWRPRLRIALADLDDPDAVIAALDAHLPRA